MLESQNGKKCHQIKGASSNKSQGKRNYDEMSRSARKNGRKIVFMNWISARKDKASCSRYEIVSAPVATYILFDSKNDREKHAQRIGEEAERKHLPKQYVHRKLEQKHHKMVNCLFIIEIYLVCVRVCDGLLLNRMKTRRTSLCSWLWMVRSWSGCHYIGISSKWLQVNFKFFSFGFDFRGTRADS